MKMLNIKNIIAPKFCLTLATLEQEYRFLPFMSTWNVATPFLLCAREVKGSNIQDAVWHYRDINWSVQTDTGAANGPYSP
jgi:hypothetical protein